jgi:hypothetical protein
MPVKFKGTVFQKRKADHELEKFTLPLKCTISDLEWIVANDECLPYLDHEALKRNLELLKTIVGDLKTTPETSEIVPYEGTHQLL